MGVYLYESLTVVVNGIEKPKFLFTVVQPSFFLFLDMEICKYCKKRGLEIYLYIIHIQDLPSKHPVIWNQTWYNLFINKREHYYVYVNRYYLMRLRSTVNFCTMQSSF